VFIPPIRAVTVAYGWGTHAYIAGFERDWSTGYGVGCVCGDLQLSGMMRARGVEDEGAGRGGDKRSGERAAEPCGVRNNPPMRILTAAQEWGTRRALFGEALGDAGFHAFGRRGGVESGESAGYIDIDGVGLVGLVVHWVTSMTEKAEFGG